MISELYKTDRWLLWVALCGSLLISAWAVHADDIINNDGIEYLKAAAAILQGEWDTAFQTYKWPFYSLTIAAVSAVSGLSLTLSAYLVNALFNAWLVLAFISLVRVLGGTRSTLWFAVLIILAFPTINKFRPYLIRDPAFLALFLSGCYAFFLYIRDGQIRHNLVAISCLILAALFRLEGLIYLFFAQGYLLSRHIVSLRGRILGMVALLLLSFVLLVFISWWQFASTEKLGYSSLFTQPLAFFEATWGEIGNAFDYRLRVIEEHVLVGYSRSYAVLVLFWSAASIVGLVLVHSLYYLYFFLWLVAWRMGLLFPEKALYAPWRFLILASLLILFGFVMLQWFLASRYTISVVLLVLLATPFLIAEWYAQLKDRGRYKARFWLAIALIVLSGIKSLDLATKKHYLREAADWMAENLPTDVRVYTNNRIFAHYYTLDREQGHEQDIKIDPYWSSWEMFQTGAVLAKRTRKYGAINIKREESHYIEGISRTINRKILAIFENEKGSRLVIFDFSQGPDAQRPEPKRVE